MDKNLILVLQKYNAEVLVLAFLVLVAVYLTQKLTKGKLCAINFYLPYIYGILFYLLYALAFSKDYALCISSGITTGAISMIYKTVFLSEKKDFTENLLSGIIRESEVKKVISKISIETDEELASTLIDCASVPLSKEDAENLVKIIKQNTQKNNLL